MPRSSAKPKPQSAKITSHATVRMVEHYNNADKIEAANALREQMSQPSSRMSTPTPLPAPETNASSAQTLANAIQAILASSELSAEAKNAAILALTKKA